LGDLGGGGSGRYFIATPLPLQKFIAGTAGFIWVQFGMDVRVEQIYLFVNEIHLLRLEKLMGVSKLLTTQR
jgi:hypothetical protein